jgi:hypothetical protein
MAHLHILRWTKALSLIAIVLFFGAMAGCGGGSNDNSNTSFSGMNQTYVISGGSRTLELQGKTGNYAAVTLSGVNSLAVSLTQHTITIGGQSLPYLADHNIFQGGGFVGYAVNALVDDPRKVPGTFNTLTGANFSGQLTISSNDTFSWCQRGNFDGSGGCTDGSPPITGAIVPLTALGFKFSGLSGNYAVYHQGAAASIFPIDHRGLNLKALTQTTAIPHGTFSQSLISAGGKHVAKLSFSDSNKLTIEGVQNLSGTYTYSYSNGELSFPSAACRNGTCAGIYNNSLGLVYLAQVGNAIFFKQ